MQSKDLKNYFLALSILMGFIFLVSFSIYYINDNFNINKKCGCSFSMPLIIILLSSLGVFVGSLTFFFLNRTYSKEKKEIKQNVLKTLDFFDNEEKKILIEIIRNNGVIAQSSLVKKTKLDKVKVFRILSKLEEKQIITKERKGLSNNIILDNAFLEIYKENI
jgi:uncharacterized membrane protein